MEYWRSLVRHYTGISQEKYNILSYFWPRDWKLFYCHGKCEYPKVYIDPIHYENPVAELTGYSEAMGFSRWIW